MLQQLYNKKDKSFLRFLSQQTNQLVDTLYGSLAHEW